jgi:hypothetical protein
LETETIELPKALLDSSTSGVGRRRAKLAEEENKTILESLKSWRPANKRVEVLLELINWDGLNGCTHVLELVFCWVVTC